jgi:hypothetical protein
MSLKAFILIAHLADNTAGFLWTSRTKHKNLNCVKRIAASFIGD